MDWNSWTELLFLEIENASFRGISHKARFLLISRLCVRVTQGALSHFALTTCDLFFFDKACNDLLIRISRSFFAPTVSCELIRLGKVSPKHHRFFDGLGDTPGYPI
jgi:hypothetical protein